MKALIRGKEIVTEDMRIIGIDWSDGAPLSKKNWYGGPYTLIDDYQEDMEIGE